MDKRRAIIASVGWALTCACLATGVLAAILVSCGVRGTAPAGKEGTNRIVQPLTTSGIYADYGNPPRECTPRDDDSGGALHVNTPALIARLRAMHANTYAFLIGDSPGTDYNDMANEFLPAAEAAGISVWAYLLPPSESPGAESPEVSPCGQDYVCWATTLGTLAAANPGLTAYVMDDFLYNQSTFTPSYVASMQSAAHAQAPGLKFYSVGYYPQSIRGYLETVSGTQTYEGLIDGFIFPYYDYPTMDLSSTGTLANQLSQMSLIAKQPLNWLGLSVPPDVSSNPGDYIALTDTATVGSAPYNITFQYNDDYTGATSGYHFIQLLVNNQVAWEQDVSGAGQAQQATVDVSSYVLGQTSVPVTFRIYDKQGVGNFAVNIDIFGVTATGLDLGNSKLGTWSVSRVNASTWTAMSSTRNFNAQLVEMVYAWTAFGIPQPTNSYIASALTIGNNAMGADQADGVITYWLDKSIPSISCTGTTSVTYPTVAGLYQGWTVGPTRRYDLADFYQAGGTGAITHAWLSTGSAFDYQGDDGWWSTTSNYPLTNVGDRFVADDFDGDGKADLADLYQAGSGAIAHAWLSNGSSFVYQGDAGWWSSAGSYDLSNDQNRFVAGDFNGDGIGDLADLYQSGQGAILDAWLSTRSSFSYQDGGWWTTSNNYPLSNDGNRFVAGDFNGDGLGDVADLYQDNSGVIAHVWLSTGSSFAYQGDSGWWSTSGSYDLANDQGRFVAGDFNGDGKDDLADLFQSGQGPSGEGVILHVWLSTGSSFTYQGDGGWWSTTGSYPLSNDGDRFVAGDFNQDGLFDLADMYQAGGTGVIIHVWLSTGSSFAYQGDNGFWSTTGSYPLTNVDGRFVAGNFSGQ